MIGTTHKTTRRLGRGVVLAVVIAATAASAALAAGKPDYGPPDPWAIPYLTSSGNADMARYFQREHGLNGGSATASAESAMARHFKHEDAVYGAGGIGYRLPPAFVTDTVLSARGQQLQVAVSGSSGFDLGSFGIGIGAGIGALLIVAAVATRIGRLRQLVSA
jgi:hypothetical protein